MRFKGTEGRRPDRTLAVGGDRGDKEEHIQSLLCIANQHVFKSNTTLCPNVTSLHHHEKMQDCIIMAKKK